MARWCSALVVALLISRPVAADPIIKPGDRVILMGDSEAFLLSREFPALAARDGVAFSSVVVPGSSVISWALKGPWGKIRRAKPDVLLVSLGANDACTGPRVVENEKPFLRTFLRKLRGAKARHVVWLGPPDIGAPHPTRTQCSRALAGPGLDMFAAMVGAEVPYLDARTIQVDLWDDHLHCSRGNGTGCATWATWIWKELITNS